MIPSRVIIFCLCISAAASAAQAQDNPSKDELLKKLECHEGQECMTPPPSRRRGFQKRGIEFKPFSAEEKKKIDDDAKQGKLPSADLEVYFDYDRAEITARAKVLLRSLGEAIADPKLAGNRFVLIGHTDAHGSDAYNQALSERRASAVKDYLAQTFNISPDRLVAYGQGKTSLKNPAMPLAAENRRVQVINNGLVAGAQ